MSDDLLNVDQLSKWLGVTHDWIYDTIAKGEIPGFKVGGLLRFDPVAIRGYLESRSFGPTALPPGPSHRK